MFDKCLITIKHTVYIYILSVSYSVRVFIL